jgi:hypothetical protein
MARITNFGRLGALPRWRLGPLAHGVAIALAQWGAGAAWADSAVGVDTALGNGLNPPGRSSVPRLLDKDDADTVRRSPSGQLYGLPYDRSGEPLKSEGGWLYTGSADVGVLGGQAGERNALFRKYKDLKSGTTLDYFEAEGNKPDTAHYFQLSGGGTGRDDQFYGLQFGRYNDWKVRLFYNETRHVFTDNWKSLFSGQGTGNLRLTQPRAVPYVDAIKHTNGGAGGTIAIDGKNFSFAGAAASNCTAVAPCWAYGSTVYSNATALAAINGVTGTPDPKTGVIPASVNPTTGALNALTLQSNIAKALSDQLAATPYSELALVRRKGGARLDMAFNDFWKGYASYSQEQRKGARPFAMNEGNISTEIAEPIDYATHEFLAGLQYVDSQTQANLRASGSLFRNKISTLNVQYPFLPLASANGAMQTATYDLYPDSDAVNLKGEFARALPNLFNGRFTAALSWGSNRQNAELLAPISAAQNADFAAANLSTLSGNSIGYATNSALLSSWNTPAALSRQTAGQRIDNRLVDLGLTLLPNEDLSLRGSFRQHEVANKGGYVAYNPLTGQFGRGPADGNGLGNLDTVVGLQAGATPGAAGSCYVPPGTTSNATIANCVFGLAGAVANGANVPVFGQARSTRQTNYGLSADYDLGRTRSLNASLEREEFKRSFREREKTWEDKIKVGFVDRGFESATLRASYEIDRKRGGEYRYRTFEDLGTGLPGLDVQTQIDKAGKQGYPALAVGLFNRYSAYFRKYDQADRDQQILNLRLNFQAREDLDLGVVAQTKDIKYPDSFYGVKKDQQNSLSLDANYQPDASLAMYGYYSFQEGRKVSQLNSGVATAVNTSCTLANLNTFGYSACSDYTLDANGNPMGVRPLSSAWTSDTRDSNDVLGLGLQKDFGSFRIGMDYSYSRSVTRSSYNLDPAGTAIFANAATTATAAVKAATTAAQQAAVAAAGGGLPDITFVQQVLNFNLLVPINKRLTLRLFDRYEVGTLKDWHYDGVITGAPAAYDGTTLILDGGPQNYRTNVVGVFLQYKL